MSSDLRRPTLPFSLTGSPFTVKVTGEGRMKESITRRRQAPSIATIGSTCDLNLKIPGGRQKEPVGGGGRAMGKAQGLPPRPLSCWLVSHLAPRIAQGTGSRWCRPRSA